MTEIEQKHQSLGDNVGNNKQTNNNHAPTAMSNLQSEKTEVTINQYNYQESPKTEKPKKEILDFIINRDNLSQAEIDEQIRLFSEVVKKMKRSDKCNLQLRYVEEGSTRFILDGDAEDLQILADLQAEGKLEALLNELKPDDMPEIKVKKAEFIEDEKIIQKAELIKNIREGKVDKKNLYRTNLSGANLSKAHLNWVNLNKANLSGANLSGAKLSGAKLSGANLSGADLSGANLIGAKLIGADLYRADLNKAKLSGAKLSGADLSGAKLNEADLYRADLNKAKLSEADLSGADLSWADIDENTQIDDKWRLVHDIVNNQQENQDLHGQDLSFANLYYSFLFRANLMGANLTLSDLAYANLQEADLSGSNLTNANLEYANLINTVFDHAIVEGAKFKDNEGITEGLKRDLIARGAIFADDFGAGDRVLARV